MASGTSRADGGNNHGGRSQLQAVVSCAKLKRKKNWFGTAVYVELGADGEACRTAKSHSSSNPKWDERLTLNVTPHTKLDFKVWSHHTLKADALLGRASLDLRQVLELHDRKLENVKEVLKLTLDKVQQNGEDGHQNGEETSSRPRTRSLNGIDSEGPSTSSVQSDCSSVPVANGNGSSRRVPAASPQGTPAKRPTQEPAANGTVNGETPGPAAEEVLPSAGDSQESDETPGSARAPP
ncbi:hypothetical protein ANANG_G00171500 [Anguilla anguilla]|uniref:C2 domain-containing protein n=1 Tax=Anguilla anguilla TaxID=7936 RepID=A0A9D3RT26_ANGAN|nr:hypothetical protein ANANG_G00171500 [Anguilla anguilla]